MRRLMRFAVLCISVPLVAAEIAPQFRREPWGDARPARPPMVDVSDVPPAAALGPVDRRMLTLSVNVADGRPAPNRNGFERSFAEPVHVVFGASSAEARALMANPGRLSFTHGEAIWSGTFFIDADRVRLRLSNLNMPQNALFWIYSNDDAPIVFGRELVDEEGGLWTPSVRGGLVHLEVAIPRSSVATETAFSVGSVMHIFAPFENATADAADASCVQNVLCKPADTFEAFEPLKQATAYLEYIENSLNYYCTGTLLADSDPGTYVPYLLTSNHCFATQDSAASLEAFWDWRYSTCGSSSVPSLSSVPRSNGATLLATGATTDFTLVRLNSVPGNRWYMGWTTAAPAAGTAIHRVSHGGPEDGVPLPQQYSVKYVSTTAVQCTGRLRPNYVYSNGGEGGIYPGSSGSLASTATGRAVGQRWGYCGPASTPFSGCDPLYSSVDGAFATTYASISQYLGSGTDSLCTPTAKAMCLAGGRFRVSARYATTGGASGDGDAVKLTNDSGYFWFFSDTNIEVVVKVLDACVFGRFWVFAGGLTNVNVVLTITDTKTGAVRQYTNPMNAPFQPIQDTNAFATCP